jgi:hypothetical protein
MVTKVHLFDLETVLFQEMVTEDASSVSHSIMLEDFGSYCIIQASHIVLNT